MTDFSITADFPKTEIEFDQRFRDIDACYSYLASINPNVAKAGERIKDALLKIGPMRPGSLTRQYKEPKTHSVPYWLISYHSRN